MKYFHTLFKQHIILIFIYSLLMLSHANIIMANSELIIETAQWVDNLNPFTYSAYPAELIVQLTTQRLIQHVCTGSEDGAYRAVIQKPDRYGIRRNYKHFESKFYLKLDARSGIHLHDIGYTLEQIQMSPMNRYHEHGLSFVSDLIEIENPKNAIFDKAAVALTFPIIRNVSLNYQTPVSGNDHITAYNSATTGIYKISSFQMHKIALNTRHPSQHASPLTFQIDDKWELFLKNMLDDKVHVGLSVNGDLKKKVASDSNYTLEETDDLNSFTYFGFNYDTDNKKIQRLLLQNNEFRLAFAFAVANSNVVGERLKIFGSPMYHTFDTMRIVDGMAPPISYIGRVDAKIARFIRALSQPDVIKLRILCRPGLIFSLGHLKQIVYSLNSTFGAANIQFRLIAAPIASEFNKKKKNKDFEIIFDTFVYGQNKLRYIEFMNPNNKRVNFLGCKAFSDRDIKTYKQKIEKRDEFLLRVNREVPVFVLGKFRNYNAISKSVIRKNKCKNSRMIPFTDIHEWQIALPSPNGKQSSGYK